MAKITKTAVVRVLRFKLSSDTLWAAWGLMKLLECQTADEQACMATRYQNGMGFSAMDAEFGSSLAKQARAWIETPKAERRFPSPFSARQALPACRIASKYAKQLSEFLTDDVKQLLVNPETVHNQAAVA